MLRRRFALATALASSIGLTLIACAPELNRDAPATGNRPDFDSTTGAFPLPSDLLKNPATGKLALPAAPADSPLTTEIKASINRLDGWLTAQTITIPFDVMLDPATLTYDNVLLYDVTRASETPPVVTQLTSADFYILFNVGLTPATSPPYNLILKRKSPGPFQLPTDFTPGGHFAAIVTDAVRGAGNVPFLDNPIFVFLRSRTPLAVSGKSTTILDDLTAVQLEATRSVYDPAFKAIEANSSFTRDHALSFTVFSVESGARAVYNPTAVGTVVPLPIDGAVPQATASSKPTITFDQPLDAATAASGTHLYRVDGTSLVDIAVTPNVVAQADALGHYPLEIVPAAPLDAGATYVAVLTDSIKGANGVATEAFSFFSLLRNANPLVDLSKVGAELNSPFLDNTLDVLLAFGVDPTQATNDDWKSAYSNLLGNLADLETLRLKYGGFFATLETQKQIPHLSVTALWQFTTTSAGVR